MSDSDKVKVGPKERHMILPEGWFQVFEGEVREGDKFADLATFGWSMVETEDLELSASDFECLIRKHGR